MEQNIQHNRIYSIDTMRGLAMVLMVMDHVRNHFTRAAIGIFGENGTTLPINPTDLAATTPVFFGMRWITHPGAPIFIFLAGIGIFLWQKKYGAKRSLTRYLLTRGALIVVLNVVLDMVMHPFVFLTLNGAAIFGALWAIGISMMLLAFVIKIPQKSMLWLLNLVIILGCNFIDCSAIADLNFGKSFLYFTVCPGSISLAPVFDTMYIYVLYPVLPWFSIMLLGYLSAELFTSAHAQQRKTVFLSAGFLFLLLFVLLRFSGIYGDPAPWQIFDSLWQTIASFLNVTKYPLSLQFMLMSLSISFFLLVFIERFSIYPKVILVFGGAPLIFYCLHFFVIKILYIIVKIASEHLSPQIGIVVFSTGGILFFTVFVSLSLYPVCLWYIQNKKNSKYNILI